MKVQVNDRIMKKEIESANTAHDWFRRLVLKDKLAVEEMLRVFLGNEGLTLEDSMSQYTSFMIEGLKQPTFEALSWSKEGEVCDLEFHNAYKENLPHQAYYYLSRLEDYTANLRSKYLEQNDKEIAVIFLVFENIPYLNDELIFDSYREFPLKADLPWVSNRIRWINGGAPDGGDHPEIRSYLRDLLESSPDKIKAPMLAKRVKFLKNTEEGRKLANGFYTDYMNEIINEFTTEVTSTVTTQVRNEVEDASNKAWKDHIDKVVKSNSNCSPEELVSLISDFKFVSNI